MPKKKTTVIAGENDIIPTTPIGTIVTKTGIRRKKTKKTAHVRYQDISTAIGVHLPQNDLVVDVPGTHVGLASKLYVPAVMAYNIIEAMVARFYKDMQDPDNPRPPTMNQLKDLLALLDEASDLIEKAWGFGNSADRGGKKGNSALEPAIKGVVQIKNAFFNGKKPEEVDLDEVFGALKSLEVETIDVLKNAENEQRLSARRLGGKMAEIDAVEAEQRKNEEG